VPPSNRTTYDQLWEAAVERLPEFSPAEQRAGQALLALLTQGEPVSAAQLASALGIQAEKAERYLQDSGLSALVLSNDMGSALGFFGLSTVPTDHRLIINGRTLWTWCAADTLFLPELIGATASVESNDPMTGQAVTLTVSPTGVQSSQPDGIVVSMNSPEAWETTSAVRLIVTACHFIHFFGSLESGRQWTESHPDTALLTLDEAFAFGRRQNRRMFGAELAKRASHIS
jgi:alkylmercury lyase